MFMLSMQILPLHWEKNGTTGTRLAIVTKVGLVSSNGIDYRALAKTKIMMQMKV